MIMNACRAICAIAISLSAFVFAQTIMPPRLAHAQGVDRLTTPHRRQPPRVRTPREPAAAEVPPLQPKQLPPRAPYTAAEDAAASIPGIPDARFSADSPTDFNNALPSKPGPWLVLSSGGEDGAFGAGLLNGLTASGKRPDYAVVTGLSTGALIAPFAFAGPHYDNALRDAFTKITAADIFEVGGTPESFVDTWPLKDLIAKEVTPALLADIAVQYRAGRRLFVVTTNLDTERSVVWNMGAIAAHGGEDGLDLFRKVLLASSSIPGAFPPVLIDVEAGGKRFAEMHVDGGVGGQFFVAPQALLAATSDYRLPATELYVVVNSGLQPEFEVVPRSTEAILAQSVGMAVQVDTRLMLDRAYMAAKRSGVSFNVASIPPSFNVPSRGTFDPDYMRALFKVGYDLGRGATPFAAVPPPYPGQPASPTQDPEKTGATR
ncbi:MAG TPA: patatin-like phospholipase family protein [Xanthobacteraceae bacterium]|nr:patatin-like phospholipase family protein [Xanthobacteraceae bacterium]